MQDGSECAFSDEWFHFAMESFFEGTVEGHFEGVQGAKMVRVDEYLIWFSKAKGEPILLHDFAVFFGTFRPHLCGLLIEKQLMKESRGEGNNNCSARHTQLVALKPQAIRDLI